MISEIEAIREQIQKIDVQLVHLLTERMKMVLEIGKKKKKNGLPIFDREREDQVLSNVMQFDHQPMKTEDLIDLYKHIIEICRNSQLNDSKMNSEI